MQTILEKKSPTFAHLIKEFEIQFKWLLIWFFTIFFKRSLSRRQKDFTPLDLKRILFLRYDKIGDMVVSLPAFHAIKRTYPEYQIDVLASPSNAKIIENDNSIDNIYLYKKDNLLETYRILKSMKKQNYDVIIDLISNPSVSALLLSIFIAPDSFKIGLRKEHLGKYYDFYSLADKTSMIHINKLCRLTLMPFNIPLESDYRGRGIQLTDQQWQIGHELIAKLKDESFDLLIAINISAGKLNRTWPFERYNKLVRELSGKYPHCQFIIFAAPDEINIARSILKHAGSNFSVVPEGLSIIDVISMLKCFDCVFSIDTSICHIASSIDVPLLALYSKHTDNFKQWHPNARLSWIVRSTDWDTIHGITIQAYLDKADEAIEFLHSKSIAG